MRKTLTIALAAVSSLVAGSQLMAGAQEDQAALIAYFQQRFPGLPDHEYANGSYALDANKRQQWEAMEEFPPYEQYIDQGKGIWNKPFANGKTFASCFADDASTLRVKYPFWDSKLGQVVTLEQDINKCLESNGEKGFDYKKGPMAYVTGYLAYLARGQKINVVVPDDPKAQAAYEDGKRFFYTKRGQLNMACSDCHVNYAGHYIRGDMLSPTYGHVTHFPVFRSKWAQDEPSGDGMGTLHRRYQGCNEQVRAASFKPQGKEYRNLEFFQQAMSNGLAIDGPGYRE